MHILKLLERRVPRQKESIAFLLLLLSLGLLLLGLGLMFIR